MSRDEVYADYAASAPVADAVFAVMRAYEAETGNGNPSALYGRGIRARRALLESREKTAALCGVAPEEVLFTSGGTESDNLAISGFLQTSTRRTVLLSALEHPAVYLCAHAWEKRGFRVLDVPVLPEGVIDLEVLRKMADGDTALICCMRANNETGILQPVQEVGTIARSVGARFLCDAVQAAPWMPVDRTSCGGADFISISGHKLGTPRGIGVLCTRRGITFEPLFYGGGQENGLRSGTENVVGAIGLAEALRLAVDNRRDCTRVATLGKRLAEGLRRIPGCVLYSRENGIPGLVSASFDCVDGRALTLLLAKNGICISPGAACSATQKHPSRVILAMGGTEEAAMGIVRYALSHEHSEKTCDELVEKTEDAVKKLRSLDLIGSQKY